MSKNKFLTIFGALTLFFWLSSFGFMTIFSEGFGRLVDITIISFIILSVLLNNSNNYKINEKVFLVTIYFLIIILFSFVRELLYGYINDYTYTLYFKTFFYSLLSLVFANRLFLVSRDYEYFEDVFSKVFVYSVFISIIVFLFYFYSIGWSVGTSFLFTEIGERYQGLSRVFGLFLLILFFLKDKSSVLLIYFFIVISVILIFSFNSFGVFFSIVTIIIYYVCKIKKINYLLSLMILSIFTFYIVDFFNLLDSELIVNLVSRGENKANSGNLEEGRSWLIEQAYDLWRSDIYSFVVGTGPIKYACYVGYCDTYRHPHNIFLLMLTWGGLASLPLILTIVYIAFILIKIFIKTSNFFLLFISSLTLYYLSLSFIGGDIEQNRFLIFFMLFTYLNYKEFFINDKLNSTFNISSSKI